jgi:glycosyltransferase involved in cell wall biosynthesis
MTLSIITVVKDDLRGFTNTAQAILSQTQKPFEWIIVDGSKGTECETYLRKQKIEFNHSYIRQHPEGIYSAMNLAAGKARGRFIWFINAGDYPLGQSVVALIHEAFSIKKDLEILAFTVIHLTGDNQFYSTTIPKIESHLGYTKASINHQGFIASRDIFTEVGEFDTSFRIAADSKFMDSAVSKFKVDYLNFALIGFELGGASSQNYSLAIRELATFRPKYFQEKNPVFLFIKNWVRSCVLNLSANYNTQFFVKWILTRKHIKVSEILSAHSIAVIKN